MSPVIQYLIEKITYNKEQFVRCSKRGEENQVGPNLIHPIKSCSMHEGQSVKTSQQQTVRCRYVNFLALYSQKTPHISPVRARYGVSFVDPASDWYSAWVPATIYVISYYIRPRYKGTRLYIRYVTQILMGTLVTSLALLIKTMAKARQNDKSPTVNSHVKCTTFQNNAVKWKMLNFEWLKLFGYIHSVLLDGVGVPLMDSNGVILQNCNLQLSFTVTNF